MSQLAKELETIAGQLQSIPDALRQQRTELARKAEVAVELANGGNALSGLQTAYYEAIQAYARERAYIIENSTSRLQFWNINDTSVWSQTLQTNFTFPSSTTFIVYAFLDDGTPVQFNDNDYYLVEVEPGVIAKPTNVGVFINGPDQDTQIPDYTIDTITVKGDVHVRLTFANPLNEEPEVGDNFALVSRVDDTLIGRVEVGIEGLNVNSSWSSTDPTVNVNDPTELENWFQSMLLVSNTDFADLCGGFLDGSIPEDDVVLSADPTVRSESSQPYNDAKLYRSPFYPALNSNEDDWPPDFDPIDTYNRKLTINGVDQWGVYPQFRWEGKLVPVLSADPTTEGLPPTFYADEKKNAWVGLSINQTDFPINGPVSPSMPYTQYYWQESDDKIYFETTDPSTDPATVTTGLYDCTYNSLTDSIAYWQSNLTSLIDNLQSELNSYTNPFDADMQTQSADFLAIVDQIETLFADIVAHHGTWFTSANDQDTTVFDTDIGTYDQSFHTTLVNYLNTNSTVFADRVTAIEDKIGSSRNRTGYVGNVISSADSLVNRNFGFFQDLIRKNSGLNTVKETLQKQRQKYDVYSS